MLQSLGWAALGTGFTFLMTALGAAMVFFFAGEPRPHFQKTLLGFAAGVMTAASVWSLLLPAIDRAAEGALPDWLPAAGGMLLGVVFLSALDALNAFLGTVQSGAVVTAVTDLYLCYELQSTTATPMALVPAWCVSTDTADYYVSCYTGAVSSG